MVLLRTFISTAAAGQTDFHAYPLCPGYLEIPHCHTQQVQSGTAPGHEPPRTDASLYLRAMSAALLHSQLVSVDFKLLLALNTQPGVVPQQ